MNENVELSEFIKFVKKEVEKSEDPKPKKGFWIGAQGLEITFETITEVDKKGGLKIYLLSAEGEKKKRTVQTVKVSFVTQDFSPRPPIEVSTGKVNW